jgi:hypothetical protein
VRWLCSDVEQRLKLRLQVVPGDGHLWRLYRFRRTITNGAFCSITFTGDNLLTVVASPSQVLMALDQVDPNTQVLLNTRWATWVSVAEAQSALRKEFWLSAVKAAFQRN